MEMAGLGKLSPNMMLIGFQEKWWACPDDADEYVRTIQAAFDLHLSVGVFRIQSGFDLTSIGIINVRAALWHKYASTLEGHAVAEWSKAKLDR